MMRHAVMFAAVLTLGLCEASGQGTKLWTVGRYEELERGSADGVAMGSDGSLTATTRASLVYTAEGNYVWSVAGDRSGSVYAGLGGTSAGSAVVMRITPDGKAQKIFSGSELAVQAMRSAADGSLLLATNPDGKVYRLGRAGGAPVVVFDPATTAEKPKYIWDLAIGRAGEIYVATGSPAAVYRMKTDGRAEMLFKTADQHVRCLLLSKEGMLWAGVDGSGVVYRIDPRVVEAKPFAMLAASQREITALAEDAAGNIYAAAVGSKAGTTLPPLPVTGSVGVTLTFVQPGSAGAVSGSTVVPDGSELYRVAADGAPSRLLALKEDVVYGLTVQAENLLLSSGNRGRIYRVDLRTGEPGRFSDVAHLEASQGTALAVGPDSGLLVGTSNSGKVYRFNPSGETRRGTYTSEVFDAGGYSRWGRAEVRTDGIGYGLSVRVGNVPSPAEGWSGWIKLEAGGGKIPEGRFAQWKIELSPGTAIGEVAVHYLQKNLAPVVEDVAVQLGARMAPGSATPASTMVQVVFPAATSSAGPILPSADAGPLTGQKDRGAATVRWMAHDDNGDDLTFAVWYRGVTESKFRLLKDKVADRFYSFDLGTLPDGTYVVKVVASDGPSHSAAEALTGERLGPVFVVDTTAPVISKLKAVLGKMGVQASFEAEDATSTIARAEYSLDAGPWQYVEPEGMVSDATRESYRVLVPLVEEAQGEHVLAVRVYDRYENAGSAKAVVQ